MATPHISAPDGAFAKTVLMPGDPLRAKLLADTFLEKPELVTSVRNIYGYTGTYKGVPLSVMASGMGIPSIGIYSYELYKFYDVENIIRIGSAGAYSDRLNLLDIVLADTAVSDSTYALLNSGNLAHILYPSAHINEKILAKANELGITCKHACVNSADVFYGSEKAESWQEIRDRTGADCVEMESFGLFETARAMGKGAACLLTISDSFVTDQVLTAEERQKSFMEMMRLAVESAIEL